MSTTNATTYVHLIGGSNFDDYYNKLKSASENRATAGYTQNDAEQGKVGFVADLQKKLGDQVAVVNHAFADFTTRSVLDGDTVGKNLPTNTKSLQDLHDQYLAFRQLSVDNCQAKPLDLLKASVESQKEATHYVVIDLGEEDMEGYRKNPTTLLDIRNLPSRVVEVIKKVEAINDQIKPILVVHRRPFQHNEFTNVMRIVAKTTAVLNALAMLTFAASAILSLTKRVHHLKGAIFCLAAGMLVQTLRTYIAPLKVTMGFYKKDIALLMINSIWERLYRPLFCQATKDKFFVLDFASSVDFYGDSGKTDEKQLLIDGVHEVLTSEDKDLRGGKRIFKFDDKHVWVANDRPQEWVPDSNY